LTKREAEQVEIAVGTAPNSSMAAGNNPPNRVTFAERGGIPSKSAKMKRVTICVGFVFLAGWVSFAQSASPEPEFEVASVKLAIPGPQGVWTNGSPDRIRMLNMSLKELISFAYDVKDYRVYGTGWIETEKYDVIAKVSSDAAKLQWDKKFALMRRMTRTLLGERFKLTLRQEKRELPVFGLVVAKTGSKIRELGPNPGDNVVADYRWGHLSAKQMPMSQLVDILGGQLDRPVLDLTGIQGVFDIKLDWTPESAQPTALETKPSLPVALEEQLGLKLEARKSPVEVIVVDHAERASENQCPVPGNHPARLQSRHCASAKLLARIVAKPDARKTTLQTILAAR
jgi:uncharacterized protein (TIGR03435 family)